MSDGVWFGCCTKAVAADLSTSVKVEIEDFESIAASLGSECFPLCALMLYEFELTVYMNYHNCVWLGLCRSDNEPDKVVGRVTCEAFLPGWRSPQGGRIFCADRDTYEPCSEEWHQCCYIELARVEDLRRQGFLVTDTLHLSVHLALEVPKLAQLPAVAVSTPVAELASQLGGLLDSGAFTDITVVAGGAEFPAHRNVLTARAPAFHKMMTAGMSEASTGRMEVSDIDGVTMRAILRFLYTGSCEGAWALSDSPVGTWHFKRRDCGGSGMASLMEQWPFYKIREADGVLLFLEKADTGKDLRGELRQLDRCNWSVEFPGGETLDLRLCNGTMWGAFKETPESEPDVTEALCAAEEVRIAECWGRLLCAADKYCIGGLVEICKDNMKKRLSVYNAASMLNFVSLTAQHSFKNVILEFITLDECRLRCVKDTREFDLLDPNLAAEVMEVFLHPRGKKRRRVDDAWNDEAKEFPDRQDWDSLSNAQLRRACAERGLATGGGRSTLVGVLKAQLQGGVSASHSDVGKSSSS